jgi:hypothetical protein
MRSRISFRLAALMLTSAMAVIAAPALAEGLKINPYPMLGAGRQAAAPVKVQPPKPEMPAVISSAPKPESEPIEMRMQDPVMRDIKEVSPDMAAQAEPVSIAPPAVMPVQEVEKPVAVTAVPADANMQASQVQKEVIYFNQPRVNDSSDVIVNEASSQVWGNAAPVQKDALSAQAIEPAAASAGFDTNMGQPPIALQGDRWQTARGAGLADTLGLWSDVAGVDLIWRAYDNFEAPESINVEGSFEDAVTALLDQFEGQSERPVASLHIDPQTGQKTLVVETIQ